MSFKEFLQKAFTDDGGKPSFSRLVCGTWIVALIVWDSIRIYHDPSHTPLDGPTLLAQTGSASTLYGLNMLKNMIKNGNGNGNGNAPKPAA